MDTFTLVASVVLLGFIAWAIARVTGRRHRARRENADDGLDESWSGSGSRRDPDHGDHHDAGGGDGGGD